MGANRRTGPIMHFFSSVSSHCMMLIADSCNLSAALICMFCAGVKINLSTSIMHFI